MTRRDFRLSGEHGLSIVELMVGVAIGLFIVAGAAMLTGASLADQRRLLAETRLHQDLRAAMDLMTRELRRAGHWRDASASPGTAANPFTMLLAMPQGACDTAHARPFVDGLAACGVLFAYNLDAAQPDSATNNQQFGFRWRNDAIEMQLGRNASWQALTDSSSMRVTSFEVRASAQVLDRSALCAVPCTGNCPRQQQRELLVLARAEQAGDARVQRELRSRIRLRNDELSGQCPSAP